MAARHRGGREARRVDEAPAPGSDGGNAGAQRRCAVTREQRSPELLLRLVVSPQGELVEDLGSRLPGRGIHVIPRREAVAALLKRVGMLKKLHPGPLQLPPPELLVARLAEGLTRRLLEGVGLARRAGALRFGLRGVEELLLSGEVPALLLVAADVSPHTREKLDRLLARHPHCDHQPVVDRERLGAACGRGPTAILVVTQAGIGRRLAADARRWRELTESLA